MEGSREVGGSASARIIARVGRAHLTDGQLAALNARALDRSCVLHVPTTWGKTWLASQAIRDAISVDGEAIAVYLCPLRALAEEVAQDWRGSSDLVLGCHTGELREGLAEEPSPRLCKVVVSTPEKFDAWIRTWRTNLDWLARVTLFVVDEIHTLGGGRRGATLEGLLTRFRALNPYARVLAMSATLGNAAELARWLDANLFEDSVRPIPLHWSIVPFKSSHDKVAVSVQEAQLTVAAGGQAIVFVQSRPRAQSMAEEMERAGLRARAHHAGLSRANRSRTEEEFRSRQIDVIVATPTLAQGVNLPAKKVIVADLSRWDGIGWADLQTWEVWQLAGRAGRKGLDGSGDAVLVAPKWNQVAARGHVSGRFEPVVSQVWRRDAWLAEQIVAIVSSRMARTTQQVVRLIEGSFGHAEKKGEETAPRIADKEEVVSGERRTFKPSEGHGGNARVEETVGKMVLAGLLAEKEGDHICATKLGWAACRHQLSPDTVLLWRDALDEAASELKFLDLLALAFSSTDCSAGPVAGAAMEMLLRMATGEPSAKGRSKWCSRVTQRAWAAAMLVRLWTRMGDAEKVAEACSSAVHEIEEAVVEGVRLLTGLGAVARASLDRRPGTPGGDVVGDLVDDHVGTLERITALTCMVRAGMTDASASMVLIDGVGPKTCRALVAAGIHDIEDLAVASANAGELPEGIGMGRMERLIEQAGDLLPRVGGAFRYREGGATGIGAADAAEVEAEEGRWRRALGLSVEEEPGSDGRWVVTGGSEPHGVKRDENGRYLCDCRDATRVRWCKHSLAVLNHQGMAVRVSRFTLAMSEA